MDRFEISSIAAAGLNSERWQTALNLAERFVRENEFSALSIQVAHDGIATPPVFLGVETPREQPLFLVASLTKPVLAMGVLSLVERGELSLTDRAANILPEFRKNGKHQITIHHLLSHCSGLPDQLPNNLELRQQQASLDEFYQQVCNLELDYSPGTSSRYQSMGYLVLDRIIEKIAGIPTRECLQSLFFEPLGMQDTYLGINASHKDAKRLFERVVKIDASEAPGCFPEIWNTVYWLGLGAPWGGMISTPTDLLRFCTMMTSYGRMNGKQYFHSSTIWASVANQSDHFPGIAEADRKHRPWGLGWRQNWLGHRQVFCELDDKEVVGHWGATGCLMWIDLRTRRSVVICTSRPLDKHPSQMIRLSNAIAAAFT